MLVTGNEQLRESCAEYADAPWIALDVEFVRRSTYHPVVALIQIAARDRTPLLIDALAITCLDPLSEILSRPDCIKVLHASSQDLEALHLAAATLPEPLFDTQVAAAFCGMGFQISFARVVDACLEKHVSKSVQQSNWLRRPLNASQLEYAECDVVYLMGVYEDLHQRLADAGRLDWVQADCDALVKEFRDDPEQGRNLPGRIRGWGRLNAAVYTALVELAKWRDDYAQEHDRPPRWVLSDPGVVELATSMPDSTNEIAQILRDGSRIRFESSDLSRIQEIIAGVLAIPAAELTRPPRNNPPTTAEKKLTRTVVSRVADLATTAGVAPEIVATTKEIGTLVRTRDFDQCRIMHGWRRELLGSAVMELLK